MHLSFHPFVQAFFPLLCSFDCEPFQLCSLHSMQQNIKANETHEIKKKVDDNNKNNSRGFFRKFFDFFWHLTIHIHTLSYTDTFDMIFTSLGIGWMEKKKKQLVARLSRLDDNRDGSWSRSCRATFAQPSIDGRCLCIFLLFFACLRSSKNNHFFPLRL